MGKEEFKFPLPALGQWREMEDTGRAGLSERKWGRTGWTYTPGSPAGTREAGPFLGRKAWQVPWPSSNLGLPETATRAQFQQRPPSEGLAPPLPVDGETEAGMRNDALKALVLTRQSSD